ncbi:MAG: TatD family hydrolase [Planctomycetota bacterium]
MLFDTHAHLEDKQLLPILDLVIANATESGLVGITAIGTTLQTSQKCLALAEQIEMVHAAVGVHPNECQNAKQGDWEQIVSLAASTSVVAIGETGLDRHWDFSPIELQREWFAKHIDLSFETNKPLVIHMRDCESDMLEMLSECQREGRIIGIMHSFAGSLEAAQQCLEWGMFISFAGMVTYKKSDELRKVARQIPLDRILVETDAPYLSPHPHRGVRPNQPSMVQHTASCLAEVFEMDVDEFGRVTTENARNVFRLSQSKNLD